MHQHLKSLFVLLVFILVFLYFSPTAWTAEISKVKGDQVLIVDFDGEVGQEFFAIDGNGKRKAIIEITKAKNGKAIGDIVKGKAAIGFELQPRGPRKASDDSYTSGLKNLSIGGMAGYTIDSMTATIRNVSQNLSGSGLSVKGVMDYSFAPSLGARAVAGYESFSVTNASYHTSISYLTLDLFGRYIFIPETNLPIWVGGGMGFAIPFTKNTNLLEENTIATSTLLYAAFGFDIKAGKKIYFPFQIDYAIYLPASDVKTSIIGFRAGMILKF